MAATDLALASTATAETRPRDRPLPGLQTKFFERLRLDGEKVDGEVTGRLLAASMIRAYDSATSLELRLDDHDLRILKSGLISKRGKVGNKDFDEAAWARFGDTRLVLDGVAFRLIRVDPLYNADTREITLTFEDELAVLMRRKKGPMRFQRGDWHKGRDTRATVLGSLIVDAVGPRLSVGYHTPNDLKIQPVKGDTQKARQKARDKGLAHWRRLHIATGLMNAEQRRNVEIALTVADEVKAGERAVIAMLCAGVGESSFIDQMNRQGSGYGGVFQGQVAIPGGSNWFAGMSSATRTREQAKSFFLGGRGYQGGGAIALAAAHPDWGPGPIALTVEGSRSNFSSQSTAERFYGQWEGQAQDILEAWGGASGAAGVGRVVIKTHPYYFTVNKGENFFDAAGRLAQEVNWRFWIDSNEIWYVPDEWTFKSATTLEITPSTPGVRGFSGGVDVGVKIGELQVTANIPRWVGSPAWRVEVDEMGPFNGLWLLARHEQDLISEDSTITLRRPAPELKEPAPRKTVRTVAPSDSAGRLDQVKLRGVDQSGAPYWGGSRSIISQFVTPFMRDKGLEPGSAKRSPSGNAGVGGSSGSDHLTTNTRAYATDYPTFDGSQIAKDLAFEMGYRTWQANSYTSFTITVDHVRFSVQILWGAAIDHADHVHVGIHRI